MLKCLMDMDGVLTDLVSRMNEFHDLPNPYDNKDCQGIFRLEHAHQRNLGRLVNIWDDLGISFWEGLEWMPDGQAILQLAEDYFGKRNVCILSSPMKASTGGADCIVGKLQWLTNNTPDYDRRYMLGSAKQFCANPEHVLIDDRDSNVNTFRKHGGQAFLVPRLWNSRYAELTGKGVDRNTYAVEELCKYLETL